MLSAVFPPGPCGGIALNIPWKADLAAPFMAMSGGLPLTSLYITGLFSAALSSLAAMILGIAGGITRDVIQIVKPDVSPNFLLLLTRILIAIVIFLPFYWTLVAPPLLAAWMAQAAIGMGGIFIGSSPAPVLERATFQEP